MFIEPFKGTIGEHFVLIENSARIVTHSLELDGINTARSPQYRSTLTPW